MFSRKFKLLKDPLGMKASKIYVIPGKGVAIDYKKVKPYATKKRK